MGALKCSLDSAPVVLLLTDWVVLDRLGHTREYDSLYYIMSFAQCHQPRCLDHSIDDTAAETVL